jgi:hypothetical protein
MLKIPKVPMGTPIYRIVPWGRVINGDVCDQIWAELSMHVYPHLYMFASGNTEALIHFDEIQRVLNGQIKRK